MDIEKFITTYYSGSNETKIAAVRNWIAQVEKYANHKSISECMRSKEFILTCFYASKTTTVSRAQYHRIKEILLNICDFLYIDEAIIPSREEVIEASFMCGFFKSLQAALSFIDEIGGDLIEDYSVNDGLIRLKSIAILAWIGFTSNEVVELMCSDIVQTNDGFFIRRGEKNIPISKDMYEILSLQAEKDYVVTFPRGRSYKYKVETNYLIKNRVGEQMQTDNIHHLFKQFNDESGSIYVLSFKGLQMSSLFVKLYEDDTQEDLYTKIQRIANCDKRVSYGYKKIYLQWVKKFFSSPEI